MAFLCVPTPRTKVLVDQWLQDLRWAHTHLQKTHPEIPRPVPYEDPGPWKVLCRSPKWKTLLGEIVDRSLSDLPAASRPNQKVDSTKPEALAAVAGLHVCTECPPSSALVFPTLAALTQHRVRKHQHKNIFQSYVSSACCPACGQSYHTRRRAIDHLSYRSKTCKRIAIDAIAQGRWAQLSPEAERELRDADLAANASDKRAGRSHLLAGVPGPKCGRRPISFRYNVAPPDS